jgi:RNA polymerase sigma-70 factor (ECF subfamily)
MEEDFQTEAMPHLDALYRYALRLTRNEKDAEDLLQDTFLRAFRFWNNYQKGTNCKAWLFRIMKNLFLNKVDKARRAPEPTSLDDTEEWYLYSQLKESGPDAVREDPASIFELKDWTEQIQQAIENLPEEFREPLVLFDGEGLSYQEIADLLELPIGTVRSRLNRARKKLQRELAPSMLAQPASPHPASAHPER